jgi:hypothetical protein
VRLFGVQNGRKAKATNEISRANHREMMKRFGDRIEEEEHGSLIGRYRQSQWKIDARSQERSQAKKQKLKKNESESVIGLDRKSKFFVGKLEFELKLYSFDPK